MAPQLRPELNRGRPRDQAYEMHLLTRARRPSVAVDSPPKIGGGAACAWHPEPWRRVHTRVGFRFVCPRRGVEHGGSAAKLHRLRRLRQLHPLVGRHRAYGCDSLSSSKISHPVAVGPTNSEIGLVYFFRFEKRLQLMRTLAPSSE